VFRKCPGFMRGGVWKRVERGCEQVSCWRRVGRGRWQFGIVPGKCLKQLTIMLLCLGRGKGRMELAPIERGCRVVEWFWRRTPELC
jgi:hypothetical protein